MSETSFKKWEKKKEQNNWLEGKCDILTVEGELKRKKHQFLETDIS